MNEVSSNQAPPRTSSKQCSQLWYLYCLFEIVNFDLGYPVLQCSKYSQSFNKQKIFKGFFFSIFFRDAQSLSMGSKIYDLCMSQKLSIVN